MNTSDTTTFRFLRSRRGPWLYSRATGLPNCPAWLICQPGLEESIHARAPISAVSTALSSRGLRSFSFDYEGDGHSDGDVSTIGLTEWSEDAVDVLQGWSVDSLDTILGIRLGAAVAIDLALRLAVRQVVLVDPITDGEAWLMQALRSNVTTQLTAYRKVVESRADMFQRVLAGNGTCSLCGYDIGQRFIQSVVAITPRGVAGGLSALQRRVRLHVLVSDDANAQSMEQLKQSVNPPIEVRPIGREDPPVWSEAASSGSKSSEIKKALLSIAIP